LAVAAEPSQQQLCNRNLRGHRQKEEGKQRQTWREKKGKGEKEKAVWEERSIVFPFFSLLSPLMGKRPQVGQKYLAQATF
jgi:hypothetical protein